MRKCCLNCDNRLSEIPRTGKLPPFECKAKMKEPKNLLAHNNCEAFKPRGKNPESLKSRVKRALKIKANSRGKD